MIGKYVRDGLSGFEGYINGIGIWDTGCVQYSIKPRTEKYGKMSEGHWIDPNFLVDLSIEELHDKEKDGEFYPPLEFNDKYKFEFNNGDQVKSIKTPAEGIVIGQVRWINGCNQYWVRGLKLSRDGKQISWWLDEAEAKLIKTKKVKQETRKTGGPDSPVQQSTASC